MSGRIKLGKCASGLVSRDAGQPCTSHEDCAFIETGEDGDETIASYGICTCGYNPGAYSYCTLTTGDIEFGLMTAALKFLNARNSGCHTSKRQGPCKDLWDDEYLDYQYKLMKYQDYPLLIGNDICVAKHFTWNYWKFLLKSNFIISVFDICTYSIVLYTLFYL